MEQLLWPRIRPEDGGASGAPANLPRVHEAEQPYDYCLRPYPPASATAGKLASLAILRETFAHEGVEELGLAVVDALVRGLGPGRTVWGVKHRGADQPLTWELYFYDRERAGRPAETPSQPTLEQVAALLAPHLVVDAIVDRPVDALMFSIEFSPEDLASKRSPGATLYVRGEDLSYELRGRTWTMGNLYRFYDPRAEIRGILARLEQCVHYDPRGPSLGRILPPRLFRAHHVCVANKRTADGVYFSRVGYGGLRWALDEFGWPQAIRAFFDRHADELDYLRHDVGFDFQLEDGALVIRKSGFYGYF